MTAVVTDAGLPTVTPASAAARAMRVNLPVTVELAWIWNWREWPAASVPTLKLRPAERCETPPAETTLTVPGTARWRTTPVAAAPLGFETVAVYVTTSPTFARFMLPE